MFKSKKAQIDTTLIMVGMLILLGIMLYSLSPLLDEFRIDIIANPNTGTLLTLFMYGFFPFAYGAYLIAWIVAIRNLLAGGQP